ncbi:hypothetical protein V2J09_020735 [Rumex salicifolius]
MSEGQIWKSRVRQQCKKHIKFKDSHLSRLDWISLLPLPLSSPHPNVGGKIQFGRFFSLSVIQKVLATFKLQNIGGLFEGGL